MLRQRKGRLSQANEPVQGCGPCDAKGRCPRGSKPGRVAFALQCPCLAKSRPIHPLLRARAEWLADPRQLLTTDYNSNGRHRQALRRVPALPWSAPRLCSDRTRCLACVQCTSATLVCRRCSQQSNKRTREQRSGARHRGLRRGPASLYRCASPAVRRSAAEGKALKGAMR